MKRSSLVRYFLALPVIYLLFYYVTHDDSRQIGDQGKTHPSSRSRSELAWPESRQTHAVHNISCHTVHVVVICQSAGEARELGYLLKTLVFHRRSLVHLHVIADDTGQLILQTLLQSWEIDHFKASFYKQSLAVGVPDISTLLPSSIDKVIYLHHTVRLLDDIAELWAQFKTFSPSQYIGMVKSASLDKAIPYTEVILLRLDVIRQSTTATTQLRARFSKQGATWKKETGSFVQSRLVERIKERIVTVLETSPYSVTLTADCSNSIAGREVTQTADFPAQSCAPYRYAASMKRRTHLYFVGSPPSEEAEANEITMLTQLTPDRFGVLEKFMSNWPGPAAAVFHVTDAESLKLPDMIASSKALRRRKNIAYHLVYKRQSYYPINYLRNVALNETRTPYVLFVDVDLVPGPGLYDRLKQMIPNTMAKRPNIVLVVPAFGALQELSSFPENKEALLKLLKDKTVVGYGMNRGWNLGHKPTNYDKWTVADEPYKAIWKDAFEPYVVMRTGPDLPRYHEGLLERMGDKIAYGREVYARGYEFWVLPDDYVIHLPHPKSEGTQLWIKDRGYMRCGSVLITEFKKLLVKQHPDVRF